MNPNRGALWSDVPLGQIAEFRNGVNYTAEHRVPGIKSINVKDFKDRLRPDYSDLEEIEPSVVPARCLLRSGDVVFVRSNGNKDLIGRSIFLNEAPPFPVTHSAFTIRMRVDPSKADPAFVAYFCRTPAIRQKLSAEGGGTNISNLNQDILSRVIVSLPSIAVQERISGTLSAYDDLVEVNQRRIAILEDMARRLFQEWFVQFRFSGWQDAEFGETELGSVPRGWTAGRVADLSSYISRGVAPRYSEDSETIAINQRCIRDNTLDLGSARRQSREVPTAKLVRPGDVLVNSTGVGTLGRVAQAFDVPPGTTVDTHVTIVRPADGVSATFFGLLMLYLEEHFERQGVGSTGQTELSRQSISDTPVVLPPGPLMETWGKMVAPLQSQAATLRKSNTRLRAARDLLLPKLLSGDIELGAVERELEDAA